MLLENYMYVGMHTNNVVQQICVTMPKTRQFTCKSPVDDYHEIHTLLLA
jgi:hypothetical protein